MSINSFEELSEHVGHKIVVVTYGDPPINAAVECETCNCVLMDFDYDNKEQKNYKKIKNTMTNIKNPMTNIKNPM